MTTKIPVELSSTPGIVDGSNATAITIDSSENVGIGQTTNLNARLNVTVDSGNEGIQVYRAFGGNGGGYAGVSFAMGNSASYSNVHVYSSIVPNIISNTDGSEDGSIAFYTSKSGTNAEKVRIDEDGNVGIGTTSPSQKLEILDTSNAKTRFAYSSAIYGEIGRKSDGNYEFSAYENGANIIFGTSTTNGATTERMRIDADGNTAIGVHNGTRAPQVLSVYMDETAGAVGSNTSAHFGGGNNSSGYLTGGFTLGFSESGTNQQYRKVGIFAQGQGSGSAVQNLLLCVRTNTDANQMSSADAKISISGTNGVASGDFNDTSDIGFKENIQDIPDSLSLVKQLQPRTFTWKGPKAGRGNSTGFIAQEVETVIPLLISGNNLGSTIVADEGQGEDGVDTIGKSINTIGLVAHLTKAIQEQQTLIEQLQAEVALLKGE